MKIHQKMRLRFGLVVALAVVAGFFAYPQAGMFMPQKVQDVLNKPQINLGLDLQGGIHLEYVVDVSNIDSEKKNDALESSLAVIERRVNAFGVGEPLVQLAKSGTEDRIIVELPGVKDVEQAKRMLKETPTLEFKEEAGDETNSMFDASNATAKVNAGAALDRAKKGEDFEALAKELSQDPGSKDKGGDLDFAKKGQFVQEFDDVIFNDTLKSGEVWPELVESQFGWHIIKKVEERGEGDAKEVRAQHILFRKQSVDMYPELAWKATGLTGKNLTDAQVDRQSQGLSKPQVAIQFDDEGTGLFADLTKKNLGKRMAIFIDGQIVSAPTVQSEITNGKAVITGNFTEKEAKDLVSRLNEGALPVPITLVGQQSVSASLGEESLHQSLFAGMVGVATVIVFMIIYYRFLGLIAALALVLYTALLVTVFKFSSYTPFSITLTLAGIAGFILSIGMAVDANILIFERTWEELRNGKSVSKAIEEGFRRAWPSIRDGNSSSILTCLILIWLGTGFVKGFAIILMIGVLFSMFTAIVLVKTILRFALGEWVQKRVWLIAPKRKLPKGE
ncbi:MAG: protein translocase subunit SecD [Candidatus Moranbacteria bacterium]|nr:protein translocase subunit SecD [Candidatus Moranbacteria bacterium]